jgi:O-antigen ligase
MDVQRSGARSYLFSALDYQFVLAIIASSQSIIVIIGGGPLVTASILVGSILAAVALSHYSDLRIIDIDLLFATFCFAVVVSFALNGYRDSKEAGFLFLSLFAYLAGRFAPTGMQRTSFIFVTVVVVFVGAVATLISLATQKVALLKPIVFGSDHSAIVFLASLSYLIIALLSTELRQRHTLVVGVALAPPLSIFAAAQVRFTFVALAAAVLSMLALSRQKRRNLVLCFILSLAVLIGLMSRLQTTSIYFKQIFDPNTIMTHEDSLQAARPADPCLDGASAGNSFVARKVLLRDAVKAAPSSGLFGTGLGSFLSMTCVPNSEPHNSILQATIEFGWLGGLALLGMIVVALWRLASLARVNLEARFVFGSLVFVVVAGMAHGILSREMLLFLFAGYAARLISTMNISTMASSASSGFRRGS